MVPDPVKGPVVPEKRQRRKLKSGQVQVAVSVKYLRQSYVQRLFVKTVNF